MTDTKVSINLNISQLLDLSGQSDRFDHIVSDRLNNLNVPLSDDEKVVSEILHKLEEYFHNEVALNGGSISATDLTTIISRGIDKIKDGSLFV